MSRPTTESASEPGADLAAPIAAAGGPPSHLFAKLFVMVLAVIATGASLLAIRHQRLETMHRIAETREAIDDELEFQRTLDARLAELVHPDRLRARLREVDVGPWVPRPEAGATRSDADDADAPWTSVTKPPPLPRFRPGLVTEASPPPRPAGE